MDGQARPFACLACARRANSLRELVSTPCLSWASKLPHALSLVVKTSSFGVSLAAASVAVCAPAQARGRVPVGVSALVDSFESITGGEGDSNARALVDKALSCLAAAPSTR